MDISFVILTWNSEKYIDKCLSSLIADLSFTDFSFEIFVVDNGSSDSSVDIISSYEKRNKGLIKPIFFPDNKGTTFSRNVAIKKSVGDFVCIMDSDIEVGYKSIDHLVGVLKENKSIGIVAPKLTYSNGMLQKSTDKFPTLMTKIWRFLFLKRIEKKESQIETVQNVSSVEYAISAMWMLRRELFEKIGLLDENIFYSPEDVDYCIRARQAGYHTAYNSFVVSVHHAQEISRGIKIDRATIEHVMGLIYYFRKYKAWYTSPLYSRCSKLPEVDFVIPSR